MFFFLQNFFISIKSRQKKIFQYKLEFYLNVNVCYINSKYITQQIFSYFKRKDFNIRLIVIDSKGLNPHRCKPRFYLRCFIH